MTKLDRVLIAFTATLCKLFDVTPREVEKVKRRQTPAQRPEDRPDVMQA